MKFCTSAAAVTGLCTGLVAAAETCKYSLEIVQLQDGSDSFRDDLETMQQVAGELFSTLAAEYPGMRFGLSSFIDKPLPGRGYGAWGGWQQTDAVHDYCYAANLPLTTDPNAYGKAISDFNVGSGFDFQENQLEGLIRMALDTTTGFTGPEIDYDKEGRPIVRIAVMITDATPHKVGDAEGCTTRWWNFPRTYAADGSSTGGFGADDWFDASGVMNYYTPQVRLDYQEAVNYFKIHDVNKRPFTEEETARFNELMTLVGPYPWPAIAPFDASLPCESTEYPSPQQAGAVLKAKKIIPVILLAQADVSAIYNECYHAGLPTDNPALCMQTIYTQILDEMGVGGVIGQLGDKSTNVVEAIVAAISQVTDEICLTTTTTHATGFGPQTFKTHQYGFNTKTSGHSPADTTTHAVGPTVIPVPPTGAPVPPTDAPTVAPVPPTDAPVPPTDAPVPPTDAPKPSTVAPVPPTDAPVPPTDAPVPPTVAPVPPTDAPVPPTAAPKPSTTTAASTSQGGVIPPPAPVPAPTPSGGGSSTGVVVGAAAGGAAVLGAAAFAAAKMGLMGGAKATADLEAIQQVEVPESPLEREAMEEVTMEMFQ